MGNKAEQEDHVKSPDSKMSSNRYHGYQDLLVSGQWVEITLGLNS